MGAIQQNNAIYLSIADGKLSRRMMNPTETSVQRTTKDGRVVNEELYKGWQGKITAIHVRTHAEYGKFWNVTLTDKDGDAIIQMKYSSGYASAFLKTLPNINLADEITFTPFMKIENEKKKTTVFISQYGQTLKHYFNKENPHNLPQMQKVRIKGETVWDDTDMMEFLEDMVNKKVVPQLTKNVPQKTLKPDSEPVLETEKEDEDSDLPF